MHRIRVSVRENQLSDPSAVSEASYLPFVDACCAWVADADGAIRGFAALDPATGTLWALFVDPKTEGSGIGRQLHDRLVAHASSCGLNQLSLTTTDGTRAQHFYLKAGWVRAGATASGEIRFLKQLGGQAAG